MARTTQYTRANLGRERIRDTRGGGRGGGGRRGGGRGGGRGLGGPVEVLRDVGAAANAPPVRTPAFATTVVESGRMQAIVLILPKTTLWNRFCVVPSVLSTAVSFGNTLLAWPLTTRTATIARRNADPAYNGTSDPARRRELEADLREAGLRRQTRR